MSEIHLPKLRGPVECLGHEDPAIREKGYRDGTLHDLESAICDRYGLSPDDPRLEQLTEILDQVMDC